MTWIAVILNLLVIAPFVWTLFFPGSGPDGAMEASMLFFLGVAGTMIIWAAFGFYHLISWLLS